MHVLTHTLKYLYVHRPYYEPILVTGNRERGSEGQNLDRREPTFSPSSILWMFVLSLYNHSLIPPKMVNIQIVFIALEETIITIKLRKEEKAASRSPRHGPELSSSCSQ